MTYTIYVYTIGAFIIPVRGQSEDTVRNVMKAVSDGKPFVLENPEETMLFPPAGVSCVRIEKEATK